MQRPRGATRRRCLAVAKKMPGNKRFGGYNGVRRGDFSTTRCCVGDGDLAAQVVDKARSYDHFSRSAGRTVFRGGRAK